MIKKLINSKTNDISYIKTPNYVSGYDVQFGVADSLEFKFLFHYLLEDI